MDLDSHSGVEVEGHVENDDRDLQADRVNGIQALTKLKQGPN